MPETKKPGSGYYPDTSATIWGMVEGAAHEDPETALAWLGKLLEIYRSPILREIQSRQRCSPERAEDLGHEFLYHWIRRDGLHGLSPERGRFRAYIKVCIANFLRDEHDSETAQRRGSGQTPESLDATTEDGRPLHDPPGDSPSPGEVLDREWAGQVIDQALEQLRGECTTARHGSLFEALKGHLGRGPDPGTSAEIGARLGITANHVNVASCRMRQRLGELIADIVRQTTREGDDWRDEVRYLMQLAGHEAA